MNVNLQLCGLVIVLFLLVLYRSHKTLNLRGERVFMRMLILTITCISLDAISVFAIRFSASIPELLTHLICKAYLVSMIWVGWINFCYVMLDLNSTIQNHKHMVKIMGLVTAAESIITALLPIGLFDNGTDIYTYGPSVISTYLFTISYIVFTLSVAIFIRRKKNSRRGVAVILTTSLWILAAIIQSINNALLLVGFSMAIGVMILYVVLENPDANLDRILGCFNAYALHSYLTMRMENKAPFSVLDISVTDVRALEDRSISVEDAARAIIRKFETDRHIHLFKNLSLGLVVVSRDVNRLNDVSSMIQSLLSDYGDVSSSVMMFTVNDAQQFETTEELLRFLTYVRSRGAGRLATTVYVSEDEIARYRDLGRIEKEIDTALEEDRVEVFLQPICDVSLNRAISAEALVRIRNRDGSLLSPGLFIPVAESTGQINELGERVLEKVCEFLRDSDATKLGIRSVHVNLSAVQCDDNATVSKLSRIVESYGIDPALIHFEITETAVSTARDALVENMNALISKGFRFALDDFGKGESNLMYIVEMPVNLLKLDMDMSRAYFRNRKAKIVVGAVSDMAHKLELPIVAEGIESKEEVDGICAEGINLIQGYYYSRPLPMGDFIGYLRSNRAQQDLAGETTVPDDAASDVPEHSVIHLKGNHILLVEDNALNAEIAQEVLRMYGFEVDTADDGTVAVETISRAKPGDYDLILMDIRMPIMDGYEATRRIRALTGNALSDIPIIALTAQNSPEDRRAALDAGMNEHLAKPIDPELFHEVVKVG